MQTDAHKKRINYKLTIVTLGRDGQVCENISSVLSIRPKEKEKKKGNNKEGEERWCSLSH